jgi:YfiH family protein
MILPRAGDSFEWRTTTFGPVLVCTLLESVAPHAFTTRHWTLGTSRGSEAAWREVGEAMGVDASALVRLRQVHGATVVDAADQRAVRDGEWPEGDVVVSLEPGRAVAVQAADCVPLLVADSRSGAVAAAHSGWRGMAAGAASAAVGALQRLAGARPDDLIAAIGPSVGVCCYEVGGDVRQAFADSGATEDQLRRWFRDAPLPTDRNRSMPGVPIHRRPGHWYLDGWTVVLDQLLAAGLHADRVCNAELCTASHPTTLSSYRREGSAAGRIAAAIRPRGRSGAGRV